MRNLRQRGMALVFAFTVAGIMGIGPTLHAAVPGSDRSVQVRCGKLADAIAAATAVFGADSALVLYLQGQYAQYCSGI